MTNAINEIKNWHLFREKFGEYLMHDAVIKRFDLNRNELTIVVNTFYKMDDDKVYDITLKFSNLISLEYDSELGSDYIYELYVEKNDNNMNLYEVTFDWVCIVIKCFDIELISIEESEPFQRTAIPL